MEKVAGWFAGVLSPIAVKPKPSFSSIKVDMLDLEPSKVCGLCIYGVVGFHCPYFTMRIFSANAHMCTRSCECVCASN